MLACLPCKPVHVISFVIKNFSTDHKFYASNTVIVTRIKAQGSELHSRDVGRGGSKGLDEPPFKPGFISKIASYLSSLNAKFFQV